jgi:molybdopterin-guanine dinucleotide biosynthesis protein A
MVGPDLIQDCTGVLMAGGRATRMGGLPKGLLRVGGEPIAARTARIFRTLFATTQLVVNEPAPYAALGLPTVSDRFPGKGAPGGVHAALAASGTGWIFVVGCDMPFLSAEAIRWLAGQRAGADAVLVRWRGLVEPLHALYSRACLPALEALLRAGDPSLRDLLAAVRTREIAEDAWRAVDPDGRSFENANTPEDAARLGLAR